MDSNLMHWYIFTRRIRQIYNVVYTMLGLDVYYRGCAKGNSG
jgi:hypothetical protein